MGVMLALQRVSYLTILRHAPLFYLVGLLLLCGVFLTPALFVLEHLLERDDFARFIHHGTGTAAIDWEAAITALDAGELPSPAREKRMLRLAASLADQAPVRLGEAVTGIDERNLSILVSAVLHAGGRRQFPEPRHETRHHLHLPGLMWP